MIQIILLPINKEYTQQAEPKLNMATKKPQKQSHPKYQQASFLCSVPKMTSGPLDAGYEIAFAGRSNAGKSSAINRITHQTGLARTSKTPGRTQHLVFFELDEQHRLVDLPGYGFAKVPGHLRQKWGQNMAAYIENRLALKGVILLMDIRHAMTELDQQMLEWCSSIGRPVHILLTKADKLKFGAAKASLLQVQKNTGIYSNVSAQMFSSKTGDGLDEVWNVLDRWNEY